MSAVAAAAAALSSKRLYMTMHCYVFTAARYINAVVM